MRARLPGAQARGRRVHPDRSLRLQQALAMSGPGGFIEELKRRHVIRIALAYAVVAWFIVQAADVLLGNFVATPWVFKTITGLLALGFPLVLFLSWGNASIPREIRVITNCFDNIRRVSDEGAKP